MSQACEGRRANGATTPIAGAGRQPFLQQPSSQSPVWWMVRKDPSGVTAEKWWPAGALLVLVPLRKWWQVRAAVLAEAWALTAGAPLGSQATQQPNIHTKVTTANQEMVLCSEHVDGQVSRRAAPTTADVSLR